MRGVPGAWPAGVLSAALVLAGCAAAGQDQEAGVAVAPVQAVAADEPEPRQDDGEHCRHPGPSDIDGDGHADAVVGEKIGRDGRGGGLETYGDVGGIHLFYGTASGLTATGADGGHDDVAFSRASAGVPGEPTEDDGWGEALAVADFDGDGCADVAVGAPETSIPGRTEQDTLSAVGEVTILYGTPRGLSSRGAQTVRQDDGAEPKAGVVVVPESREKNDRFGAALAAADFDGDGLADLAIATPGEARGENRIPEHGGCIDWYTPEEEAYCKELAAEQAKRPKVDPNLEQGAVSVVYGSPDGLGAGGRPARTFMQSDAFIGGESENNDEFGHALAAGDFDADGVADLAVSVPNERRSGVRTDTDDDADLEPVIHVLPGKRGAGLGERAAQTLNRATAGLPALGGGAFGYVLAAGDLDGKAGDDLAIGAPYSAPDGAVVVLYSAGSGGLTGRGAQQLTPSSIGVSSGNAGGRQSADRAGPGGFGDALAIGRFGGPGSAQDLAVGKPLDTIAGEQDGSVTVLFGGPAGLTGEDARFLAWATPRGENGDQAGSALAALPIRNPGSDDLLIGAPSAGENATPTDGAGALIEVPTGKSGPRPDAVRRWRPDTPDVAGEPVRGGSLGHTLT